MVMEEQESNIELASERIPVPQVQQPKLDVVKRNSKSGVSCGKPRLRKKALHNAIVKQMEFYFSDANLSKDRYLSELLKKSPYVDLDIFTTFNKLSALTTDTNRIAKALQRSTILKVTEDGTKVYRLTPINIKENVDECTIYVQNLPLDADHDWLISVFSKYGSVVYVSIPRYKSNRKIKGFAFVEFDTPTGANECIKAFQEKGCVLPSHTPPDDLLSITTFNNENNLTHNNPEHSTNTPKEMVITDQDTKKQDILKDEHKDDSNNDNETEKLDNTKKIPRKRKLTSEKLCSADENDIKAEKMRTVEQKTTDQQNSNVEDEEISNKSTTDRNETTKTDKKKKRKLMINDIVEDNETAVKKSRISKPNKTASTDIEFVNNSNNYNENDNDAVSETEKYSVTKEIEIANSDIEERDPGVDERKKKKNRKKRNKIQKDIACNMIQVMAKRDWKRLRNKYLELQKNKMQQLKLHLRKTRWNYDKTGQNFDKSKYEKDYGKANEMEKTSRITYTSGVIVKIEMTEPCTNPDSLKMELKNNSCVKYVDVINGSCEVYIRCDTAEAAQTFVEKSHEGRRLTILKDEEEKSYWDKIEQDRKEKLGSKKRYKNRGRDKLLKKAERELGKCIKFDQV